jgi:hypothetical protein
MVLEGREEVLHEDPLGRVLLLALLALGGGRSRPFLFIGRLALLL